MYMYDMKSIHCFTMHLRIREWEVWDDRRPHRRRASTKRAAGSPSVASSVGRLGAAVPSRQSPLNPI
jgi:hypothetical protein